MLAAQNDLGIAPEITLGAKLVDDGRHHMNIDFWGIGSRTGMRIPTELRMVLNNQVFWLHERQLILWNEEVGKWPLLLQKGNDV